MKDIALHIIITLSLFHVFISKKINYNYYNYDDIMAIFTKLAQTCPQYIRIDTAQNRYGLDSVKGCGASGSKCDNLIVYMTDFDTYTLARPHFYASGLVHGDEIIGPTTITEFALYYCRGKQPSQFALNLLKQKMLIFTPMTNAYGFYNKIREDIIINAKNEPIKVDPNRDFPYTQELASKKESTDCMQTITARTINEIFKEHIIQSALTFHGGANVLGHAWGNYLHLDKYQHSTESPDHSAFRGFGEIMRTASSSTKNNAEHIEDYVLDDMSKAVYPVDGGLEDWAYAGSWENDINSTVTPIKTCKPSTYTSYQTNAIPPFQLRCIMFLVETDNEKQPLNKYLGYYESDYDNSNDIFNFTYIDYYGHIPRNMRLIFSGADLISANFYMRIGSIKEQDITKFRLEVILMGCETVGEIEQHTLAFDLLSLSVLSPSQRDNSTIGYTSKKDVNCYWRDIKKQQSITTLYYDIPLASTLSNTTTYNPKSKGTIIYYKGINPDKEWSIQTKPDPNIPPQSHVVKSKTNPRYNVTNNNYSLKSNNHFYSYPFISFDNGFFIIADDLEALLYPIQNDITFIFYITSQNKKKPLSKSIIKLQPKTKSVSTPHPLHYSSQIEYDISLLISIGGGAGSDSFSLEDLLLNDLATKSILKAKTSLSIINDNKLSTPNEHECLLYYLNDNKRIEEMNMFIKCDRLFEYNTTNASFIRSNLLNSLFGLNWSIKDNLFQLRGIFSSGKFATGKFFGPSLTTSSDMICNSHIRPNSILNLFEIQLKRISNYKINLTLTIPKSVLDNPLLTSYLVLVPYANSHLIFNLTENDYPKEIKLDPIESNGRIIGKTVYVFKIQSDNDLKKIQAALKDKHSNEILTILESPSNSHLQMNKCSITTTDLFIHNELAVNMVFSDKMPSKPIDERINEFLLMFLVGINVIGLIVVLICCVIKLKKKLFKGYDKIETRMEMETIQIEDTRKKDRETIDV